MTQSISLSSRTSSSRSCEIHVVGNARWDFDAVAEDFGGLRRGPRSRKPVDAECRPVPPENHVIVQRAAYRSRQPFVDGDGGAASCLTERRAPLRYDGNPTSRTSGVKSG